jgi:hypothetical protein
VTVNPSSAQLELDGLPAGTGTLERDLPADGRQHALRASAGGRDARTVTFVDAPPPPTLDLPFEMPPRPEAPKPVAETPLPPVAETPPPPATRKRGTRVHPPAPPKTAPAAPSVGANQAPILKE